MALAVTAFLADLWFVSLAVVFGSDGIFTEGRMGYPGMMDPTGQSYQADVVDALRTTAWWTFGTAALAVAGSQPECRCASCPWPPGGSGRSTRTTPDRRYYT